MDTNKQLSPEELREIGKKYIFCSDGDPEKRSEGFRMIVDAHVARDPEATYLVARFLLDGLMTITSGKDVTEHALALMMDLANGGYVNARAFINNYCENRYRNIQNEARKTKKAGPLVDFEGKRIKIKRKGLFTPVDAVLEYKDGKNILNISTNVHLLADPDDVPQQEIETLEKAVNDGILAWQGEYEVFGGQKLYVRVSITNEPRLFDTIMVFPVTDDIESCMKSVSDVLATKRNKSRVHDILNAGRSFATAGFRWSVTSRKNIFLLSKSRRFDDYNELMHVAKHEFGHALGLGDLYYSPSDQLFGVENGLYKELDCYSITDRSYNLVMCDHHGPISNNDIEMVVLAFSKNHAQLYQKSLFKGKISKALGRGN